MALKNLTVELMNVSLTEWKCDSVADCSNGADETDAICGILSTRGRGLSCFNFINVAL